MVCIALAAGPGFAAEEIRVEEVVRMLQSGQAGERFDAVAALADSGNPEAVPLLLDALEKDMRDRTGLVMAIIPAIGELGDERAVPLLLEALKRPGDEWLGRSPAARALGRIGSPKAVPALISAAWLPETRQEAVRALARIEDARAVDVLVSALNEQEAPVVGEYAYEGLRRIGVHAIDALLARHQLLAAAAPVSPERIRIISLLGMIGGDEARATLLSLKQAPEAPVRKAARKALRKLK